MLITTNDTSRHPVDGHLVALTGQRTFGTEFKYRKGRKVFGDGQPAEYVYQIISGAVRTNKLLADGRRQVNSFHLPGDMFGFENGAIHRFSAEALVETRARKMTRSGLLDAMASQKGSTTKLLSLITQSLQHAETHMLLLGRKTAVEKVAAFLLEMDDRLDHPNVMILPMSRRDIADYVGLTLETVSRAFSALRDERLLRFVETKQRQLVILNRLGLAQHDS